MVKKQGYLKEEYKIFKIKDVSDREYPFHYHDFYKLIVFMNGNVDYIIEGKNYKLSPGDIVLVAANEIHRPVVDPFTEYERIVLYLSQSFFDSNPLLKDCFEEADKNHTNVMRLSGSDYARLSELFVRALERERANEYSGMMHSKLLVLEGLLLINESVHVNGLLFEGKVSYDRKILDVCDYINEHLKDDLSVDFLSEHFYISKYYFMRKFKEYTGVTLHHYILEKRLLLTKRLVENGEKVTVACIEAGFKDYSTYLRAKKRESLRLMDTFE